MPETTDTPRKLAKPVDYDDLYPGRFLKAADFKGKKVTLTIGDVNIEELEGEGGKKVKATLAFKETEKQLVTCKTNGLCIKAMFGRTLAEWVGKRVTLFPDTWNGEPAVRVWGSPDIAHELDVEIALPRRRPFKKTMHKVAPGARAAEATASGTPPPAAQAIATLRAAASLDEFVRTRKSLWALYANDVPIEVEAAANERRETLEAQA